MFTYLPRQTFSSPFAPKFVMWHHGQRILLWIYPPYRVGILGYYSMLSSIVYANYIMLIYVYELII